MQLAPTYNGYAECPEEQNNWRRDYGCSFNFFTFQKAIASLLLLLKFIFFFNFLFCSCSSQMGVVWLQRG